MTSRAETYKGIGIDFGKDAHGMLTDKWYDVPELPRRRDGTRPIFATRTAARRAIRRYLARKESAQ